MVLPLRFEGCNETRKHLHFSMKGAAAGISIISNIATDCLRSVEDHRRTDAQYETFEGKNRPFRNTQKEIL